jgi:hypothetical protein
MKKKPINDSNEGRMARIGVLGGVFFFFALVSGVAADDVQATLAQQIASLREEVQKIQEAYDSWSAQVDLTLKNLSRDNQGKLSKGSPEGIDAQRKQDAPVPAKPVSPKASTAAKAPSSTGTGKTIVPAAQTSQNQKASGAQKGTTSNKGNVFIGVPLAPAQKNTTVYSNTSSSKGMRIVSPKVTVVGGSN